MNGSSPFFRPSFKSHLFSEVLTDRVAKPITCHLLYCACTLISQNFFEIIYYISHILFLLYIAPPIYYAS